MRIAIVLDPEESAAHRERQSRIPEMLDPDPEQRLLAETIEAACVVSASSASANDDERRAVGGIDLFETLPGPEHEPPVTRYLYTLIGEGF